MAPESRDEVRQRIDSLYDQAENATGNYNATRAMTARTRTRGVPLRKRPGGRGDPALDEVARQWFDVARAKLGPTVPAVLPADRMPERPVGDRPGPPPSDGGPEAAGRPVPELPPGPTRRTVAELTGGPAPALPGGPLPALPAGSAPALTGGPAPEPTGRSLPETAARSGPEPAAGPVAALPAVPARQRQPEAPNASALPAPAIGRHRPSPADSKESNRRKLAAAREMLTRHAVRQPEAVTAIEPRPEAAAASEPRPEAVAVVAFEPQPEAVAVAAAIEPRPGAVAVAASEPRPEAAVPSGSSGTGSPVGTESFAAGTPTVTDSFAPVGAGGRATQAVAFARAQIGRPCVWGATGPDSYDYAGLTQAAWKAAGVSLPRSAQEQALAGTPVALTGIRGGDLVFFFDNDGHVGLYVGDGMMVHAPGPGSAVREESIYGAGESAIHRVIRPA